MWKICLTYCSLFDYALITALAGVLTDPDNITLSIPAGILFFVGFCYFWMACEYCECVTKSQYDYQRWDEMRPIKEGITTYELKTPEPPKDFSGPPEGLAVETVEPVKVEEVCEPVQEVCEPVQEISEPVQEVSEQAE